MGKSLGGRRHRDLSIPVHDVEITPWRPDERGMDPTSTGTNRSRKENRAKPEAREYGSGRFRYFWRCFHATVQVSHVRRCSQETTVPTQGRTGTQNLERRNSTLIHASHDGLVIGFSWWMMRCRPALVSDMPCPHCRHLYSFPASALYPPYNYLQFIYIFLYFPTYLPIFCHKILYLDTILRLVCELLKQYFFQLCVSFVMFCNYL